MALPNNKIRDSLPNGDGRLNDSNQLKTYWAIHEDGVLAENEPYEEIKQHVQSGGTFKKNFYQQELNINIIHTVS